MSEVRRAGYTVFHGDVFDVRRFAKHHPGGAFLTALAGQDATVALENAHGKSQRVRKMLSRFHVGVFDVETRDPLDRDLLDLRAQLRAEGLFTYGPMRVAFDLARWVVLFGAGLVALHWSLAASFALVLAGTIDVVWWIHDAGHDAVFEDELTARRAIDWLGVIVLGMPQQGYHYGVHRVHHAFTNVIGVDRALETGPLSWDARTAASKPAVFLRARVLQWFLGVIPVAGPALLLSAVAYCVEKRQRYLLAALGARWLLVIGLCLHFHAAPLIVAPWVAGSILAFMAGLNHFHLPMSTEAPASYARAVFERTQNIERAGRFWSWISGGLDLHIEHHLFPMMASYRYRAVAPRVRALAERHGVPYHATSRSGAVGKLVVTLLRPLRPLRAAEAAERSILPVSPRHRAFEVAAALAVRGMAILLPAIVAAGVTARGVWSFAGAIVVFGVLSAVEFLLHVSGIGARTRAGADDPPVLARAARAQLWVYALGHVLVFPYVLVLVARGSLAPLELVGAGLSLACMGGTVGGLGGHELMHKRGRLDRLLGIALYATANYGHFISSHISGHHVNVGLRQDWGTARRGETIYAFLYRAVVHGFVGGLRIEGRRLRRQGRSPWSLRNFVVRYALGTLVVWAAMWALGGARTLVFFLIVSAVTIAFMELFNYISHYALERPCDQAGRATAIEPEHTWESNNKVVNWFIFNAGMHCHHHHKPAHGFEELTLFHEKEYIPHGIAMMAVIAFLPPLYLRTMDRILADRPG